MDRPLSIVILSVIFRKLMKTCALCFLFLTVTWAAQAGNAPASISDTIWLGTEQESSNFSRNVVWYKPDGTFQVIFGTGFVDFAPSNYQAPVSGTYQYSVSVSSPDSATLTTQISGSNPFSEVINFTRPSSATYGLFDTFTVLHRIQIVGGANTSSNAFISPGQPGIAGFVVSGSPQLMLLRVVGPALLNFGVAQPLLFPSATLYSGSQQFYPSIHYDLNDPAGPWRQDGLPNVQGTNAAGYQLIFDMVGAFPLTPGAGDWATLQLLPPGGYTLVATAPSATQGRVLCEAYFLPYAE